MIFSSSLNLSIVSQCGFNPRTPILGFFDRILEKNLFKKNILFWIELILNFEATFLWNSLNYIFIIVSFTAVYKSVLNSSNSIIKSILFTSWFTLTILILNEQFEILHLQEVYTYLSASILCVTHFYNLKNCRCDNDDCCSNKKF